MIDIHCHILPGIDDGPEDLHAAVWMAKSAVAEGIETVIATPHVGNEIYNSSVKAIKSGCSALNCELEKMAIPLTVLPGAEIYLTPEVVGLWERNCLMGLAGNRKILLLELPNLFILDGIIKVLKKFVENGVQVFIAHPERNLTIFRHPEYLNTLRYYQAKIQVTAGSLCGAYGRSIKVFAEKMLWMGAVDCIASDMHPDREFRMRAAYERVKKIAGEERVLQLQDSLKSIVVMHRKTANICTVSG